MKDEKKFLIPEAIIVEFNSEDIIVTSGGFGEYWGGEAGDEYHD